jgi:prephenate dehydrogenase
MRINNIAIIGLGLIGGSLAKSLKHSGYSLKIAAFDFPDILKKALSEKTIDVALKSYQEVLKYDLIFIAFPIEKSVEIFNELSPLLKENQILSDICSVKGIFADSWERSTSKGCYIGAHPMAGKEKGGYQYSDNLLFENSIFIISDQSKKYKSLDAYLEIIKKLRVRITFVNPYLHDKIISKVSHLPQLLSVLLINQAASTQDGINYLDFGAGGFRDMTRIAASDFGIWGSIIKSNKKEIINSLSAFKNDVDKMIALIENDSLKKISDRFEKARTAREEIPFNNKGFLSPLFEITIFLKDEPGVIAKLSKILFENNINIKDLELLKIREGSGGNFKLYFESEIDAVKAKILLEKSGFKSSKF